MPPLCVLTRPGEGLIDGADVDPADRGSAVGLGDHPYDGHLAVELLGPGGGELGGVGVPASPLQVQPVDVAAPGRQLHDVRGWGSYHLGEEDGR